MTVAAVAGSVMAFVLVIDSVGAAQPSHRYRLVKLRY